MSTRTARQVVLCGCLMTGIVIAGGVLQAHHAVAGVYDLNKEVVLQGRLKKLNFTNPHASIELTVPNKNGTFTDWVLTTASITTLTREGINKTSMKPGEILKVTILPARNGNPAGFIRNLTARRPRDQAVLRRRHRLTRIPRGLAMADRRSLATGVFAATCRDEPGSARRRPGPAGPGAGCRSTAGPRRGSAAGSRCRSAAGSRRRWRPWRCGSLYA